MINQPLITSICVVNTYASARFDRGLDYCSRLVHNMTTSFENIFAGFIRPVLTNNEGSDGLITCRRPSSVAVIILPVTVIGSVIIAVCFVDVERVCANASGANNAPQASMTIVFFICASVLNVDGCILPPL